MPQEGPHLGVPPLEHGVHAHEGRPAVVRRVERRQRPAVRIRAPRPHHDGADPSSFPSPFPFPRGPATFAAALAAVGEVVGKGGLHRGRGRVLGQREVVARARGGDEGVDGGERVGRRDEDRGEGGR